MLIETDGDDHPDNVLSVSVAERLGLTHMRDDVAAERWSTEVTQ